MEFLSEFHGKRPVVIYVIGSTKTSLIPGITVAGARPELTLYTPACDVEYLYYGRVVSLDVIPTTPEGIPTPALITRAALDLSGLPFFVVDSGTYYKPKVPYIDLGGVPGEDIRTGRALPVDVVEELFRRGLVLGEVLSRLGDFVVLGESIPAGTTTALAIMVALGLDAWGKVSSACRDNPHSLKERVVKEALKKSGLVPSTSNDPLTVLSHVGDPVHTALTAIAEGVLKAGSPVMLAGGTQMCAVLTLLRARGVNLSNAVIGTTRWIVEDRSSDIIGLVRQIGDVPILAANLNFSSCRFYGLRAYEEGYVKEGVGAGGTCIVAYLCKGISMSRIVKRVEELYGELVKDLDK